MKTIHTQEQIKEMRRRLYARGNEVEDDVRHELTDDKVAVSKNWNIKKTVSNGPFDTRPGVTSGQKFAEPETSVTPPKKRHYRSFVMLGSLLIFVFVAVVSSLFLYFGGNKISNDNINISLQGPIAVGGGEEVLLQAAVVNQNSVPIESAILILKYPVGTRSVGDSPRNLFEERIPIDDIEANGIKNVPIKIALFGEENAEKIIEATVEYRINGSNGTFYKDAEPLSLRINSSPLVLRIENIEKVASGQLVNMLMTVVSNASTPLSDVLVTASYPNGFSFETSDPDPVYGQNVWRIDELLPEQEVTIKLQGIVSGLTDEMFQINFNAGPANLDNQYLVGATLAEADAKFLIERPFIDVNIAINNDSDREVVIPENELSEVEVNITNTLDETVYDMTMEVLPQGNALDENSIISKQGFYNSNDGTVRFEVSNNATFEKVLPGESRTLSFGVRQGPEHTTSAFDLVVNVYARRVAETSAQETLIGTARAEAKYSSKVSIGSQAGQNTSRFTDSGPIPPRVGEVTTYTISLVAEAGANDLANAVVETSLPLYVNWLDEYDADGEVTYNSVSKKIRWVIGDIPLGSRKEFTMQVDLKPSSSQIGDTPVLLNSQFIKANDRFTSALLQDKATAVTTELSAEMGYQLDNGAVER